MPLPEFDPQDYEYMNHPPQPGGPLGALAFGEHPDNRDERCGKRTKQMHDHPEFGLANFRCTRSKGHMGRHEASVGDTVVVDGKRRVVIVASWADKPEEG